MPSPQNESKEYTVSINTDDINEAISQASDALYHLVLQALASHECPDVEECQFEAFARDVLAVLDQHSEHLAAGENSSGRCEDEDVV